MRVAYLITPLTKVVPVLEDVDYIGVDAGSLLILEKNLPLKFCVGDFDSMKEEDLKKLEGYEMIRHPIMKDETDSELALRLCTERGYQKIVLYGAISGRVDHTISNIRLLMYTYPNIVLEDEWQRIQVLEKGEHVIENDYHHVSFFAIEPTTITLTDFLYNLDQKEIDVKDIYTVSNSIVGKSAKVQIKKGRVLLIQSNLK